MSAVMSLGKLVATPDKDAKGAEGFRIDSDTISLLAWVPVGYGDSDAKASAEFIVRACNMHEALVKKLSDLVGLAKQRGNLHEYKAAVDEALALLAQAAPQAEATAHDALLDWYRQTYELRTRAVENGTAQIDWVEPNYRVSWTEVVAQAEKLGIKESPVDLRLWFHKANGGAL